MRKILCVIAGVVFLFIGCPKGQRASIMGLVSIYYDWYTDSLKKEGDIEGHKYNGFNIIPIITINKDTLPMIDKDSLLMSPTEFGYEGAIPWINSGDECKFKVDYGEGKGEATGTIPGEFQITSPDTAYVLHKGNDLNITWSSATGADWYWLTLNISYSYTDTAGYSQLFLFYLDTIIEGTSYTVKAGTIFPGDVDTVQYGLISYIYVEGNSGPKMEPGAKGNIKGDAVGFFWCRYGPEGVYFGVGQLASRPKDNRQAEIRKKHLEAMREFASENE